MFGKKKAVAPTDIPFTPYETIDPGVRLYIADLLVQARMLDLSTTERKEMIEKVYFLYNDFFSERLFENMPSQYHAAFIELNNRSTDREEIESFMRRNITNVEQVMTQVLDDFRDMFLANMA